LLGWKPSAEYRPDYRALRMRFISLDATGVAATSASSRSWSMSVNATFASAVTHRARSTRFLGPNERAVRCKSTLGFRELAELSHGDPTQGERGRVVPKRSG
jgi:hypothetical protein